MGLDEVGGLLVAMMAMIGLKGRDLKGEGTVETTGDDIGARGGIRDGIELVIGTEREKESGDIADTVTTVTIVAVTATGQDLCLETESTGDGDRDRGARTGEDMMIINDTGMRTAVIALTLENETRTITVDISFRYHAWNWRLFGAVSSKFGLLLCLLILGYTKLILYSVSL